MKEMITLLLLGTTVYGGLSFQCTDMNEGHEKRVLRYEDTTPTLVEVDAYSNRVFIAPNEMCGLKLSNIKTCDWNKIHEGNDYNYSFRCDEVYGDLYFTGSNGGYAEFRCFGEKVTGEYSERIYKSCIVSP